MTVKQLTKLIVKRFQNPKARKRALYVHGSPGVGKSSSFYQATEILSSSNDYGKVGFIDIRLQDFSPVDLIGLMFPDKKSGTTKIFRQEFWPGESSPEYGIIVLDELSSAPAAVQAVAYQIVLDRRIGNYSIPDGYMIVAAGNLLTDRAVVNKMSSALANRFSRHIFLEPDFEEWKLWAYKKQLNPNILSFLERHRDKFAQKPDKAEDGLKFATPRSWEFCSEELEICDNDDEIYDAVASCVGSGIAIEFMSHLKLQDLCPSPEDIIVGKIKEPTQEIIDRPDVQFSLVSSVVFAMSKSGQDKTKISNVSGYFSKLPTETAYMFFRELGKTIGSDLLMKNPDFRKYAEDHAQLLLSMKL